MAKKEAAPEPLRTYGMNVAKAPPGAGQLYYERMAFRGPWPIENGGLGRYQHFRNICKICWPWLEWNPWMEKQAEAMCENSFVGLPGCVGSSKTTTAMIYAAAWWLCAPNRSTVIITSTTGKMIRKRGWPWIQRLYSTIEGPRIGNFVDSKTTWQCKRGDDKNAIFALPVKEGNTMKAAADIAGMHNIYILLIIDEATDTPEAIFESIGNMITGTKDFQCIAIGNPQTRFDQFGVFCEPKDGWNSVDVETHEWETRLKFNRPGLCIRFDAERSPNIIEGRNIYKHIPTMQSVEAARKQYGENAPAYWQKYRGMWAPEGVNQTVLTESLLIAHDAFGKHVWMGTGERVIAACDPAFGGGDRPVLQFGKVGEIQAGGEGLQMGERVLLKINAKDSVPVHFQLSAQIIRECKQRGVKPQDFGLDSTGEGGGLADIVAREWSLDIVRVEFGGKPSDRPVSNENNAPADEVYDRRVSELWFAIKELVMSNQLKGLDATVAMQLFNRRWKMKGKKIEIEPKSTPKTSSDDEGVKGGWGFKQFYGRSPDEGDALATLVEVARRSGLNVKAQGATARVSGDWLKFAMEADSVYVESGEEEQTGQRAPTFAMEWDG